MTRKRARFDVVSIEIAVHCPHCDALTFVPGTTMVIWNADAIKSAGLAVCKTCFGSFRLPGSIKNLLLPSTERVSMDRRVSEVAQVEIICANCAGDEQVPKKTLLTTDGRCATCGSQNVMRSTSGESTTPAASTESS